MLRFKLWFWFCLIFFCNDIQYINFTLFIILYANVYVLINFSFYKTMIEFLAIFRIYRRNIWSKTTNMSQHCKIWSKTNWKIVRKKKQNTQFLEIKNHDFMKNVSKKSLENTFDQKSSNQNDSLLVNTFQFNLSIFIQREIECLDSNDQNIQSKNLTQVDNMQRNQKNQIFKMNANENIDVAFF